MKTIGRLIAATCLFSLAYQIHASPKTLVFCSEGSPSSFNPSLGADSTTFDASSATIYNRLVEFKLGTTELQPSLAQRWDISDDGKTYTFYLRPNVQFHHNKQFTPTRNLNADDVIFSFMRQQDSLHPFYYTSKIGYPLYHTYFVAGDNDLIEKIEKVDDLTVRFQLSAPRSSFLSLLTLPLTSIYSAEYGSQLLAQGKPELIDFAPIGTGPFEFVAYKKDSQIRYKTFENYWRQKPDIDRLVFTITPDATIRYAKLQKGECHVMASPNLADLQQIRNNPTIRLLEQPSLNVGYLAYNVEKKPLDNVKVRQALSMAINKPDILQGIYQGYAVNATTLIPPALWSHNANIKDLPNDIDKAKVLLSEAGYPQGFEIELWAMPIQRPYNPNAKRMAEMIQEDWAKIGVTAKVVSYEWGEYLVRSAHGEHQAMLYGGTNIMGDPDNTFSALSSCAAVESGTNRARWCNSDFDRLIIEGGQVADIAQRTKLYEQAQQIMSEQIPFLPIAHSVIYEVISNKVTGYTVDPLGLHHFDYVGIN
ncbi:ABC transporter substrate-binding protein [Orbus mooreae]|uniref:ABC transporter substrate-binding protein n=1 Tax=Orbus mooreae TaxID=3074107 RepID=UPI00370D0106